MDKTLKQLKKEFHDAAYATADADAAYVAARDAYRAKLKEIKK